MEPEEALAAAATVLSALRHARQGFGHRQRRDDNAPPRAPEQRDLVRQRLHQQALVRDGQGTHGQQFATGMGPCGQDAGHIEFIDALDGFATAGRDLVGGGAVGGQQHARQGQLCLPESLAAFFHGGADAGGPLLLDLLGQVAVKAVGGSAGATDYQDTDSGPGANGITSDEPADEDSYRDGVQLARRRFRDLPCYLVP